MSGPREDGGSAVWPPRDIAPWQDPRGAPRGLGPSAGPPDRLER